MGLHFANIRVIIVGDIMLDRYIQGGIARISPEAPVPVVRKERMFSRLGGAGNVAANIVGIGGQCHLISVCGRDAMHDELQALLQSIGCRSYLYPDAGRPTICKTRVLAGQHHLLRIDDEETHGLDAAAETAILQRFSQWLPGSHAVIVSDYGKGVCSEAVCRYVIRQGREHNIPVFVDPKGTDWSKYIGATCLTPNQGEFAAASDSESMNGPQDTRSTAAHICRTLALQRLLMTRGAEGMLLVDPLGACESVPARVRHVFDVSGAGDTVIATLAACRAIGMNWRTSMETANLAAGIVVGKIGTQPVTLEEMQEALDQAQNGHLSKVHTLEQAMRKVAFWRTGDKTIVFTNGCFDLLHPGHVHLLRQAAMLGDKLVVGLNSDRSVARLKGNHRPVLNQNDRSTLLASLQDVDMVIVFDEDTPESLIAALRPDVLIKGADYSLENVVGADMVTSWGGRVILVDLKETFGTSAIIEKITRVHGPPDVPPLTPSPRAGNET